MSSYYKGNSIAEDPSDQYINENQMMISKMLARLT